MAVIMYAGEQTVKDTLNFFFFFASIPEINTEVQHPLMGTFFSSVVLRMSSKRSIDKTINLISKRFPSPLKLNDPL